MDGGASGPPLMRPQSSQKRSYSTMAASHRHDPSFERDEHYDNEHAARRRRRFEAELRPSRIRFPGDGLDFRRPVMSPSAAPAGPAERHDDGNVNERMNTPAVIDLTDDDALERPRGLDRQSVSATSHTGSAREWSELRPDRSVIDLESSGEEREVGGAYDTSDLPGANYLALPNRRPRPRIPPLRRHTHHRSPSADMDDIEFISERQWVGSRRQISTSLPGTPQPRRTATPYPPRQNETIDLTEDDDEVVQLRSQQRDGVNLAPPEITAGTGTRTIADRGFQHMGHIVNLLREGGAQIGGRLYQRMQDFAGPGVFEEFEQHQPRPIPAPHGGADGMPRARIHHHHAAPRRIHIHHGDQHGHGHFHARYHAGDVRAIAQALGVQNDMAGLMDYHMTAFDMGLGRENVGPPTPKYEPPPPAAEGFTHSPQEGEVVVCPNCGDELAMGDEGIKREVWVVKSCGHAYCGECAHNRSRPTSRKGKKGKAPVMDNPHLPEPFSKCVVPGCGKAAGKTSMIHVYLGS